MNKPITGLTFDGNAMVSVRDVVMRVRPTLVNVNSEAMMERAGIVKFAKYGRTVLLNDIQVVKLEKYLNSIPKRNRRVGDVPVMEEVTMPTVEPVQEPLAFENSIEQRLDGIELMLAAILSLLKNGVK